MDLFYYFLLFSSCASCTLIGFLIRSMMLDGEGRLCEECPFNSDGEMRE